MDLWEPEVWGGMRQALSVAWVIADCLYHAVPWYKKFHITGLHRNMTSLWYIIVDLNWVLRRKIPQVWNTPVVLCLCLKGYHKGLKMSNSKSTSVVTKYRTKQLGFMKGALYSPTHCTNQIWTQTIQRAIYLCNIQQKILPLPPTPPFTYYDIHFIIVDNLCTINSLQDLLSSDLG